MERLPCSSLSNVLEGKVIGRCVQRHRHQEFIARSFTWRIAEGQCHRRSCTLAGSGGIREGRVLSHNSLATPLA
jgi:hypothetical protein